MDDDFELQFADDLEALDDIGDDFDPNPRSRRSLTFTTPQRSQTDNKENLDSSVLTPMFSPTEMTGSMMISNRGNTQSRKRPQNEMCDDKQGNDPGLCEALPDVKAPNRKRQKCVEDCEHDDFEITPPASPKIQKSANPRVDVRERLARHQEKLLDDYDFERQRVLRRIPAGDFMTVTSEDGSRVYMSLRHDDQLRLKSNGDVSSHLSMHLLGKPLNELKMDVEAEKSRKLIEESERISEQVARSLQDTDTDLNDDDISRPTKVTPVHAKLWVEQYSPHLYTELLSDESTNRTVLKWLKLWDKVVFNKDKRVKKPSVAEKKKKDKDQNVNKFSQYELTEELDQHGRPLHRIALLCGPPGLGKTTLAHVLARHAGYNVVEMNASDDRSVDVFKTKIEAATQMKAVMGADPRPNCLIIDEIDGAPQPAINMLLSLVKKTEQTSKKKKDSQPLLRPIICICNDQYAPALRQLRQNSLILNFPPTVPAKLALRLQEIIRTEKLMADMSTLLALCEKSENDIRSCLNTLQFVQRRSKQLTLQMVQSMSLGQKDQHKSLFSVWTDIFTLPKQKRRRYINPHERTQENMIEQANLANENSLSLTARFHTIHQMAQSAGEYEKVTQGLHENYLNAKCKDSRLEGMNQAAEWLCFVDLINRRVAHTQSYDLAVYIPYMMVVFHLLFASNNPQKCKYPSAGYEFFLSQNKSMSVIGSLLQDISPQVKKNMNVGVTVMDVLPLLTEIIMPTLRPVNTQLYSAREKNDLKHLIHIMIAYNLTYNQERTAEGQYTYVLDPNVEQVVQFPGLKQQRQLSYAAKQLIAREIELEKMRRSEAAYGSAPRYVEPSSGKKEKQNAEKAAVPNHLKKLEPKCIKVTEDKLCRDFFGRVIKKSEPVLTNGEKEKVKKKDVISSDIWFKFQEGYSNAVRKTVRIQDLL